MSETTNLKLFKHDNPATNENQFDVTKALNNNWDKIDDFAETTNTKITENQNNIKSLQTDNTKNKQDIATLKSDNTTNKANIKALQDDNKTNKDNIEALQQENEELKAENERLNQDLNALPSNTAEGEYITLTDSADSRFNKFRVIGKSEKKTRSGKNKIKVVKPTTTVSGVDFTNNEDGSITINGTATANAYFNINNSDENNRNFFTLEKNQNYGLYLGISAEGLSMICRSSTKNYELLTLPENQNEKVQQYTAETDTQCWAYLKVESGVTINNLIVYPMIVKGTEIGEWELYGALPRPNEESPIQNVEGNVNVTICNRNIANSNEVYSNMKAFNSQQCSEIIEDEKECIKFDNTSFRPDMLKHFNLINFKFKENTSYTIRGLFKKEKQSPSIGLFIQVVYTDGTQDMADSSANGWIELRLVSNASKTIRNIGFSYSNPGYYYLDKSSIFIGEGNANDYILNQQKKFIFPLSEGQKMYEESYLASDGIHHKRKQVKLIPSDWTTNMPLSGIFYFSNSSSHIWDYTGLKGICTHFQNAENENVTENYSARNYLEDNQCNVRNADTKDRIYFKNSAFTTVEQWRDFFNNNDVLFEYECEEYVEAYTDEQQAVYDEIVKTAKSYKTVTNIFSTNEVSPKFEIEYRQDIKSLINNVSQAVLNNA